MNKVIEQVAGGWVPQAAINTTEVLASNAALEGGSDQSTINMLNKVSIDTLKSKSLYNCYVYIGRSSSTANFQIWFNVLSVTEPVLNTIQDVTNFIYGKYGANGSLGANGWFQDSAQNVVPAYCVTSSVSPLRFWGIYNGVDTSMELDNSLGTINVYERIIKVI